MFVAILLFHYLVPCFSLLIPQLISDPLEKLLFRNKCLGDLGCFYTGPPFYDPLLRPISVPPFNLNKIRTKFLLYTRNNTDVAYNLKPTEQSLSASPYDRNAPLKIFIHGYIVPLHDRQTVNRTKKALLDYGDFNVIIVDWTSCSGAPYVQAIANARVVGRQVAQLVRFLEKSAGVDPRTVHIIGHSLGSHTAGWAGEKIPNLGRITGLDPAGPFFRKSPRSVRLDRTDALFVDVIHTNAAGFVLGGLGITEPIGHLDFYPNGGAHQPGCETTVRFSIAGISLAVYGTGKGFTKLMTISCDHNRANDFFIESINNQNCTFIGTFCDSYKNYKSGKCQSGKTTVMGFSSTKVPDIPKGSKLFLDTSDKSTFCITQNEI